MPSCLQNKMVFCSEIPVDNHIIMKKQIDMIVEWKDTIGQTMLMIINRANSDVNLLFCPHNKSSLFWAISQRSWSSNRFAFFHHEFSCLSQYSVRCNHHMANGEDFHTRRAEESFLLIIKCKFHFTASPPKCQFQCKMHLKQFANSFHFNAVQWMSLFAVLQKCESE